MTVREGRTTKPLYEPEPELTAALQPYEDATWNEYMLKPIGTASDNFTGLRPRHCAVRLRRPREQGPDLGHL